MCHEMHAMSLGYMPVRKFIEGDYKNPAEVYQSFPLPARIPSYMLYVKYAVKEFTKEIYNPFLSEATNAAKEAGYYEQLPTQVISYLETEPITKQAKVALVILICTIVMCLWIMVKFLFCFLRCCGCNIPCCYFCCGCCSSKRDDKVKED